MGPALARLPQRGADAQVPQEARGGRPQEGTEATQQPGNCFHKIMDQSKKFSRRLREVNYASGVPDTDNMKYSYITLT